MQKRVEKIVCGNKKKYAIKKRVKNRFGYCWKFVFDCSVTACYCVQRCKMQLLFNFFTTRNVES